MIRRMSTKSQQIRVCIVGAGVSGLRAADVLLQHGAHVTIYEARDRVGGRVSRKATSNLFKQADFSIGRTK